MPTGQSDRVNTFETESRTKNQISEGILSSPCFANLPTGWVDSVQVVEADLALPNCGIEESDLEKICREITHIIHGAGCVSFKSPILEAITANVTTSLNICNLAEDCPNLQRLTTTLTAYVQPHRSGPIYEELVSLPYPATKLLENIRLHPEDEADILRFTGHQNTYALTKRIAEHVIIERKDTLPITIIRPSIISASRSFPFHGWIDSHTAFAGFVAAFGSGILHVIDGDPKARGDIVPVDDVARRLIDETLYAKALSDKLRIVYAAAGLRNCINWNARVATITKYFEGRPAESGRAAKLTYFRPRNLFYPFHHIVRQRLPFLMTELYFRFRGDLKMQLKTAWLARLVETINRVFPYFVHHTFDFRSEDELLGDFDTEEYLGGSMFRGGEVLVA